MTKKTTNVDSFASDFGEDPNAWHQRQVYNKSKMYLQQEYTKTKNLADQQGKESRQSPNPEKQV